MSAIKIGLPCSPSKRIKTTEIKSTRIKYSYGGGIGGSNTVIHSECVLDKSLFNNKFVEVKTIYGETVNVNTDFVVDFKDVTVVIDYVDTTAWSNFSGFKFTKTTRKTYFEFIEGEEYVIYDDFCGLGNNKLKCVEENFK